jgi:hypothetical protein
MDLWKVKYCIIIITINPLKPENKEQKTDKTRKVGGRGRYQADRIWLNTKVCAVFTTLGFHG